MAPSWVTPQQLQRLNKWIEVTGGRRLTLAELMLSAYSPGNGIVGNFFDNSLVIKDPITPANDYTGPLIDPATGLFNKLTFSRPDATTCATYKDASGVIRLAAANVPRISYESYGRVLLMEGARTQQFLNSVFAGGGAAPTSWSQQIATGISTPGVSSIDPTAIAYTQSATAERPFLAQAVTTVAASVYAISIKVEAVSGSVTLADVIMPQGIVPTSFVLNGVVVPGTTQVAVGSVAAIYTASVSGAQTIRAGLGVQGNVTGSIRFSCPQHELGSWPSSYIQNTSTVSTVTRAAETCSLANTLFNLTQSAGTLYVKNSWDGGTATSPSGRVSLCVSNNTSAERTMFYNGAGASYGNVNDGGVNQADMAMSAVSDSVLAKQAMAFASSDFQVALNGALGGSDASGTLPTTTQLDIGMGHGSFQLNGGISEFAFFGSRISNANLQALTA